MVDDEPELELDGPWKEAIDWYFEAFIDFFFAPITDLIDWSRGFEFLDKELQKIAPDAFEGRGTVDKLARVWLNDGSEGHVFVHIEVQNQHQTQFSERMYTYHHRLRDRYGRMPISLAILGDESPHWKPDSFSEECGGCRIDFRFPIAKLLEWEGRDKEMLASANPFAVLTLAHLKTLRTRGQQEHRQSQKLFLIKGFYDRGFDRERIIRLFRLIDWIMALSPPRRVEFETSLKEFEEERNMPFVSPTEQLWLEKGIEQGIEKGIETGKLEGLFASMESILDVRFGEPGVALMPRVRLIPDLETAIRIQKAILNASSLNELEQFLPNQN